MRHLPRLSALRPTLSATAMAALLAGGTWMIFDRAIDGVAARHAGVGIAAGPPALRPTLSDWVWDAPLPMPRRPTLQAERSALQHDFSEAFVEMLFMLACSFGAPAAVVLYRTWQKRRGDETIRFLERHDVATGTLNRAHFLAALDAGLRLRAPLRLHLVAVDGCASVNERFGPVAGEAMVGEIVSRLRSMLAPGDLLGRLDSNIFAVARPAGEDAGRPAGEGAGQGLATAEALCAAVARPFRLGDEERVVTANVGVAEAPEAATDAAGLVQAAGLALQCAQADGRNAVRLHRPEMEAARKRRQSIEEALLAAVEENGFALHYQPVVAAEDGAVRGYEALLRLPGVDGAVVSPAEFVPVAEDMGLIGRIGAWVVAEACRTAAAWPAHLSVAVNLSPRQLETDAVCREVEHALQASGLQPRRLELELTESVVLDSTEAVLGRLARLKALGVSIAMDDFGTGYSSLATLWRFPFDKLKIDRSFMPGLAAGDAAVADILKTILSLGRSLKMAVTAEGVETAAQAALLREFGCDLLQGYHFGRPGPGPAIAPAPPAAPRVVGRPGYTFKGSFAAFATA